MKCKANHSCEVCPPDNTLAFVDDFVSITLREAVNSLNCEEKGKGLQNQHVVVQVLKRLFILTLTGIIYYKLQCTATHSGAKYCVYNNNDNNRLWDTSFDNQ